MLDWIFEGIVTWVSSIAADLMDAVSGIFLQALGTDMSAMEGYFPFVTKAFDVMQYMAWAVLFLITVWQLFRVFGGPITEAENPWQLLLRSALFALLVGAARPIFTIALDIARAPYTALLDVSMEAEDFTFAGVEEALKNGVTTAVSTVTIVGPILILILLIALGWNYFKLLLETVERYIVVGVLCYTSPLAYAMGGSKATNQVFKSWCRMVGSQLLLLVMNVWFLRAFDSSVGQFIGNGGALASGNGSVFLWLFCALAFLKTAQKFDSYLASLGLNVAQTGSSMAMEMVMAARVLSGLGGGSKSAGTCSALRVPLPAAQPPGRGGRQHLLGGVCQQVQGQLLCPGRGGGRRFPHGPGRQRGLCGPSLWGHRRPKWSGAHRGVHCLGGQPAGGCLRRHCRGHRRPEPAKLHAPALPLLPGRDADHRRSHPHHRRGGESARGSQRVHTRSRDRFGRRCVSRGRWGLVSNNSARGPQPAGLLQRRPVRSAGGPPRCGHCRGRQHLVSGGRWRGCRRLLRCAGVLRQRPGGEPGFGDLPQCGRGHHPPYRGAGRPGGYRRKWQRSLVQQRLL